MRRLGMAKPLTKIGIRLPSKLILWNDVEALVTSSDNVVLSKTYDKLATMHPSDLADIIEDFDTQTGMMIFSNLDNARSADVLEEMEEDAQIKVIENLSTEKAADILEEMPSDEAADILDGLEESKAEELLLEMEKETSDEIRDLMQYEDNTIGSIMNAEFVSFPSDHTVESVIKSLREQKPEEGLINYIYVTNVKGKLAGKVTLRDLIFAEGKETLKSLMHKDVVFMYDTDEIEQLIEVASKYNLLSIPIVNHEMQLEGNVIIHDILDEILSK
jgi:magnesium transporter